MNKPVHAEIYNEEGKILRKVKLQIVECLSEDPIVYEIPLTDKADKLGIKLTKGEYISIVIPKSSV